MKHYSEQTIAAFMSSSKPAAIMAAAEISRSTYYRLKSDPAFQKIVNERRSEIVKDAVLKMESYLLEDIEILQGIARDNETAPQVRINAINSIMNQLNQWKMTAEVTERVLLLEESMIKTDYILGDIINEIA